MTAESLINLILLFFAYAFLGWCIEVTLKYFQFHRFINRGFDHNRGQRAFTIGILCRYNIHGFVYFMRRR